MATRRGRPRGNYSRKYGKNGSNTWAKRKTPVPKEPFEDKNWTDEQLTVIAAECALLSGATKSKMQLPKSHPFIDVDKLKRVHKQASGFLKNGIKNLMINAGPGCAKTTTVTAGLHYAKALGLPVQQVTCGVFSNTAKDALNPKLPEDCNASTVHSFGYKLTFGAWRQQFKGLMVQKSFAQVGKIFAEAKCGSDESNNNLRRCFIQALEKSMMALCTEPKHVLDVMAEYGIDSPNMHPDVFAEGVISALNDMCKQPTNVKGKPSITFPFMVYGPWRNEWNPYPKDRFKVLICDECQDISPALRENLKKWADAFIFIGDRHQCIDINSIMDTPNGPVKAKDLKVGDRVISYRKGEIVAAGSKQPQSVVRHIRSSDWTWGYKIITKSGKSLTMSPNHKIWATEVSTKNNEHLVYLMFRSGFGFRVGVTKSGKNAKNKRYGLRPQSEGAERFWILDKFNNLEEALLQEETYSLEYGIPTSVFRAKERGINQKRVDAIFCRFGENGRNLLNAKNLNFDLSHWQPYGSEQRRVIKMVAHNKKYTSIEFEWSGDDINEVLEQNGFNITKAKDSKHHKDRYRIRSYSANYRIILEQAEKIQTLTGASLSRKLSTPFGALNLLTASALHVGMSVPVNNNGKLEADEIVSIEKAEGEFIDIDVDDASNFFSDGILSHNSIFHFAGADSDAVDNLIEEFDCQELPLMETFRCPKQIVERCNDVNTDLRAADCCIDGEITELGINELFDELRPGDVVLSRKKAPLITMAFAAIRRGMKANIINNDIGDMLVMLMRNIKAETPSELLTKTEEWKEETVAEYNEKGWSTVGVSERADCLIALVTGLMRQNNRLTIRDITDDIDERFRYVPDEKCKEKDSVMFGTIHRSKGLEWPRCWILNDTYLNHPKMTERDHEEEKRIRYVGESRVQEMLGLVYGTDLNPYDDPDEGDSNYAEM